MLRPSANLRIGARVLISPHFFRSNSAVYEEVSRVLPLDRPRLTAPGVIIAETTVNEEISLACTA